MYHVHASEHGEAAQNLHERANVLAWVIVCAFLGYGQLFQTLGFEDQSAPSMDEFGQTLMTMISEEATR